MIYDLPGDFWLTFLLQSVGDWLTPIMKFFTWLGYPQAYMIIVAILYWSFDRKLGLRLAIFLPVIASLNSVLKQAFHAPRPFWLNPEIKAIKVTNGFGMPSGHAQASTVWLYAAACVKRRWIWFVALILAFFVGLSRVYLGVHFSSQVVIGWLIGIGILILFVRFEGKILTWFLRLSFFKQFIWLGGITFTILTLGGIFVYFLKDWEMPLEWIRNSADDLAGGEKSILSSVGMGAVAGNAGGFLGVALGALLSHRRGGFETGGPAWKRLLRSVTGLICFSALYGIFLWIAPQETRELVYSVWRFCGFFVLSFFAIFLAPVFFRSIKLVTSSNFNSIVS
jgi:membrane-associated phospholipid phosphatase